MSRIAGIAVFCLSSLIASRAWAGMTISEAFGLRDKAYSGDMEALVSIQSAANDGDCRAEFVLATMYIEGHVVPWSAEHAFLLNRQSAEAGYAPAQNMLGSAYERGSVDPLDYGKAMFWYRKAVDRGNAEAMISIGLLYHQGYGVPKDDGIAKLWYEKARAQGHAMAWMSLAHMYIRGDEIQKNDTLAFELYEKAANAGYRPGQIVLANAYSNGGPVPKDIVQAIKWTIVRTRSNEERENEIKDIEGRFKEFSAEQIEEGEKLASEWLANHKELDAYETMENP